MSTIDMFEAMLARGQDNEMLRYTLGNAYLNEGQHDLAVEHLRAAVVFKPDYSAAWKQLGKALSAAEQWEDALRAFDEGAAVCLRNGDIQAGKEIAVFQKRVRKRIASLNEGPADHHAE